ncbi:FAD-binding protein [Leucobacter weissii]|uniref:FAD-binding protein n=1 Tax=Leucobacter weissii TaxID=1983706 RepID=A0A939ML79_9MICO|nr:FAD-binding protein [Leucobacter weissii]MBO1900682.1 FAD-binding protein [Leucobacter weissii]
MPTQQSTPNTQKLGNEGLKQEFAYPERVLSTGAVVIGAGGAGLRAAIEFDAQGVDVLVLGKRRKNDAHTILAAGGINAALGTMDPEDSWQQHAADTIKESYFLGHPHTAEVVARGAARGIQDLVDYGCRFSREEDGRISQRFFGAHKWRRTSYFGDYTGLEIHRALLHQAQQQSIEIRDTVYVTRILVSDGRAFGVYGFDVDTGERIMVFADVVVLAAGGHNRIWKVTSSRKDENTGDALRLAHLAGAEIQDAELVQFHPSGILEPLEEAGTLITEAARGEGGILRNALGERYMAKYDPERMELSTRDRVALASYTEIAEGRGTDKGGVWLDVSHLPDEIIHERLPRIYNIVQELQGKDITQEPIEIAPTSHYTMGGVRVSPEDHSTGVDGLYAIGETSAGLHGANRLGGNSLIELLVYGRIVGEIGAARVRAYAPAERSRAAIEEAREEVAALDRADGPENAIVLFEELRQILTDHAGVVRSETGLTLGLEKLAALEERAERIGVHTDIASYLDLTRAFNLKAGLIAARATLESALARTETRGAHNRSDFPEQDESLRVNMVWSGPGRVAPQPIPAVPEEIAALIEEISTEGKILE